MSGVVVTPVDEFEAWRRQGERKLQQLVNYREGAEQRLHSARKELDAIDAAISVLSQLLAPGVSPLQHRVTELYVVIRFEDGSEREFHSSEWRTVLSVFTYAAELIAEKQRTRHQVIGDPEVT